jgi:hypothetical protein
MILDKRDHRIGREKSRPQLLVITMVIAVVLAATARYLRPAAVDSKVVELPTQFHEFGTMMANSKNRITFLSTNILPETLVIDHIDRSCGCTSAICDRKVVPPGQTFAIDAMLSALDFPQDMSSLVTVRGHAGQRQLVAEYQLHGTAQNIIEFPDAGRGFLNLGAWRLDQLPAETAITVVRGHYPLEFDELRADSDSTGLITSVEPVSGQSWRVHFHMTSDGLLGGYGFPITFSFARHGEILPQTVVKQAFVEVQGPVTASPPSLLLEASAGEHFRRTISIMRRSQDLDAEALSLTAVTTSSTSMVATWQNDPRQNFVTLEYTAPAKDGQDRGEIIISVLDRGQIYKIKVSYMALIS